MDSQAFRTAEPQSIDEVTIRGLYQQLLDSWNTRSSDAFASLFLEDGDVVGFDGSQHLGQATIAADLGCIFTDHPTPAYIGKVRSVRFLSPDVAVLRAVAGMTPPGQSDIAPQLNAVQSLVAFRHDGLWSIASFQNTPAQFHRRPELASELTEELRQLLLTPLALCDTD